MRTIGFVKSQIKETIPFLEDTKSVFSTIVSNLINIKNNLLTLKFSLYNAGESFDLSESLKPEAQKLKELSENMSEEYINEMLEMLESHRQTVQELEDALNQKIEVVSQYDSNQTEDEITEFKK